LESVCTGNRTKGSNPFLSAIHSGFAFIHGVEQGFSGDATRLRRGRERHRILPSPPRAVIIGGMKYNFTFALMTAAILASTAGASAHFKLVSPPAWINTNDLGDPQKAGPCGGDPKPGANEPILSKIVTKVAGGSMLPIKIQETIFHSGHYRVALAVNSRTELPPDPYAQEKWTERGLYSVWGQIQSPPQIPVLADGLFQHYNKPGEPASQRPKVPMAPWETQVQLPNINCEKCTLQVIQFMADHVYNQPGGYAYHHCADLQITADPAKPIDTRWPGQTTTAK
jgi:hypothetical protein